MDEMLLKFRRSFVIQEDNTSINPDEYLDYFKGLVLIYLIACESCIDEHLRVRLFD